MCTQNSLFKAINPNCLTSKPIIKIKKDFSGVRELQRADCGL